MNNDKKEFELNLQSPAFKELRFNLDTAIISCLHELYEGNFAGGDITAKINIELESDTEVFSAGTDNEGRPIGKSYSFKKPTIEHNVGLTLKKRVEAKGGYIPGRLMELKRDGEKRFVLSEVTSAQMTLHDVTEER